MALPLALFAPHRAVRQIQRILRQFIGSGLFRPDTDLSRATFLILSTVTGPLVMPRVMPRLMAEIGMGMGMGSAGTSDWMGQLLDREFGVGTHWLLFSA